MSNETFERAALDGKDREQLQAIAGALGLKAISRLKKAELVDAILGATNGSSNGSGATPRKIRSTGPAKSELDELAAEEDALAAGASDAPDVVPVRRRAPGRTSGGSAASGSASDASDASGNGSSGSSGAASAAAPVPASDRGDAAANSAPPGRSEAGTRETKREQSGSGGGGAQQQGAQQHGGQQQGGQQQGGQQQGGQQGGQSGTDYEAPGNRRRRRRRGRERDRERGFEQRPEELTGEAIEVHGLLDLRDEGYGFLRTGGYLAGRSDAYVSASQVRRFALRKGDFIKGATRAAATTEKYPALMRVDEINGLTPDDARNRPRFEDLTPLFPDERLSLELHDAPLEMTGRIVDLISPIGKGQRGMVVSPPKAGKTTILKQIVYSIERNNPEVHLMVLLVDERPEEVTDMRRHVLRGEVIASTFDRPSDEHTQVAELTIDRAKRLVEMGKDVVIILDGITRLARAYNLAAPASGRIMSGGIDAGALYPPKKFFGAARNVEEGGSLTIVATALVETNSKMDEHIFEEFKGTGNMELRLDRRLAERRIYPAIDVEQSSTRHEELLFDRSALQQVWKLRRVLNALEGGAGLELLIDKIRTTKSNDEFLAEIAKSATGMGA